MVYPASISLMRTPRLPVVDLTDALRRFKWTRPFREKDEIWFLRVCHDISNAVYALNTRWTLGGHLTVSAGFEEDKIPVFLPRIGRQFCSL